jgi:hypothetical protein
VPEIVLAAVQKAGVRAIISAGWADLGGGSVDSEDVLIVKGETRVVEAY